MPRITIEDLPVLEDLSPKEKKGIFGGTGSISFDQEAGISVPSSDALEAQVADEDDAGGAGTGKVLPQDMNIIKRMDK